jgi:hypothetical protein
MNDPDRTGDDPELPPYDIDKPLKQLGALYPLEGPTRAIY